MAAACVGLVLICGAARAQEGPAVPYRTEFVGLDGAPRLERVVRAASQLVSGEARPPATLRQLRRRIAEDLPRLDNALRSRGHYAATAEAAVDTSKTPAVVTVTLVPGPAYTLAAYRVEARGGEGGPAVSLPLADLGLKLGTAAEAAPIKDADTLLLRALGEHGYPLAEIAERKVVVDHDRQVVEVTVDLDLGPAALFGETRFVGLENVDPSYAARRIAWQPGEIYDTREVEQTRAALRATQLFTSVRIDAAERPDAGAHLPMTITVVERPPRSIGAGAGYSTSEGLRGKLFWEHRNLLGAGERLRASAVLAEIVTSLSGSFVKPDFLAESQELLLDGSLEQERTDAFSAERIAAAARLRRPLYRRIRGSGGIAFERSFEETDDFERAFTLVSLPIAFDVDTSDDPLDPSRGARGLLAVTPTPRALGGDVSFVTIDLAESRYVSLTDDGSLVLAGRYRFGSIVGGGTAELPAAKRFYAGGGGSVRGYAFQSIGPRDASDPFGGRSLFEVGGELRWRVWQDIGLVTFVEGGDVWDDEIPDLEKGLRWGTGLGVRYFTAVGPLRLDVAMPLQRRRDIDDSFQFYVSLGQAF